MKREGAVGAHELLPNGVDLFMAIPGQDMEPLAALLTRLVLPLGLNALFEEVEIGAVVEAGGREDVVVQAPEIFHSAEGVHLLQGRAVRVFRLLRRVIEP